MEVECKHCHKKFEVEYKCTRCNHTWTPRENKQPKVCPNPKCKSPYWDRERVRDLKKKNK